jgi:hypothetical protein
VEWKVTYQMMDLVKSSMVEKVELVERVVDMVEEVKSLVSHNMTMLNMSMFPRFLYTCSKKHMTDKDVGLLGGLRRDVSKEVKDRQCDRGSGLEHWNGGHC